MPPSPGHLASRSMLARWQYWSYSSLFLIAVKYRKTVLGPLWLLAGPAVLIGALGYLYATINGVGTDVFVPFLTLGIIIWSLITAFMVSGTTVIYHNRTKILNGAVTLTDAVMTNILTALLRFAHHLIILIIVWLMFRWEVGWNAALALAGLALLVANGVWYAIVFGILGTRFRDISEIVGAIMGAMFFLTPILWMPEATGRGGILGAYLTFNPFYHYVEVIRAPLLGIPVDPLSWIVVITLTIGGSLMAWVFLRRFRHQLPTWF